MKKAEGLIAGIGVCCEDRLGIVKRWPDIDQGTHLKAFSRQCGGMVATALAAASRLGVQCAIISMAGRDEEGLWLREQLRSQHVDVSQFLLRDNFTTPSSMILIQEQDGHRRIFHYREKPFDLRVDEVDLSILSSARFLHLDGHMMDVALEAADLARQQGIKVCLDASNIYPGMESLLSKVDYLICNRGFPLVLTGRSDLKEALTELSRYGCRLVAATLGESGVMWLENGSFSSLPAFDMDIVDTTGAGDVFHGAFLAALCRDFNTREAMKYASAAGALACRALGGQSALPDHTEVMKLMERS
jgi:sugar/nucleoside kinase (ribokinase family)